MCYNRAQRLFNQTCIYWSSRCRSRVLIHNVALQSQLHCLGFFMELRKYLSSSPCLFLVFCLSPSFAVFPDFLHHSVSFDFFSPCFRGFFFKVSIPWVLHMFCKTMYYFRPGGSVQFWRGRSVLDYEIKCRYIQGPSVVFFPTDFRHIQCLCLYWS